MCTRNKINGRKNWLSCYNLIYLNYLLLRSLSSYERKRLRPRRLQSYLGQKEVLELLLLVRHCDHSSISVYNSDLLNSDIQLQLDGPL